MTEETTQDDYGLMRSTLIVPNPVSHEMLREILDAGFVGEVTLLAQREATAKEKLQGAPQTIVEQVTIFSRVDDANRLPDES